MQPTKSLESWSVRYHLASLHGSIFVASLFEARRYARALIDEGCEAVSIIRDFDPKTVSTESLREIPADMSLTIRDDEHAEKCSSA